MCEGNFVRLGRHLISPFGESVFRGDQLYLGFYSRSGVHVKTGFSFRQDYFAAGQLKSAIKTVAEQEVKVLKKQEDEDDSVIEKLIGPDLKTTEFQATLVDSMKLMMDQNRLCKMFLNHVDMVKVKRNIQAQDRINLQRDNALLVCEQNMIISQQKQHG